LAKEIIMPKFGFTQEESEILEWLKQNGDKVEKGDPIAVVSTDKVSMEVEAPESGILDGIRYKVGDTVPVTQIIAYVLQPGEKIPESGSTPAAAHTVEITAEPKTETAQNPLQARKERLAFPYRRLPKGWLTTSRWTSI
jgi:pyruvate/2-oxoglutarate dehydrogenase complex dihydrolipoamide acyltransferase (E2) component